MLTRLATPVPFDPDATDLDARFRPPDGEHLLGTDDLGRDVLSRLLHGARVSVAVGLAAAALAFVVGTLLGARGREPSVPRADRAVLFVTGVVQAFPALVLVAAGAALAPPSPFTAAILIALTGWPEVARLVRAEALRLSASPHVEAARAAGRLAPPRPPRPRPPRRHRPGARNRSLHPRRRRPPRGVPFVPRPRHSSALGLLGTGPGRCPREPDERLVVRRSSGRRPLPPRPVGAEAGRGAFRKPLESRPQCESPSTRARSTR